MKLANAAFLLINIILSGSALAQIDVTRAGAVDTNSFSTRYALSSASAANLSFAQSPNGGDPVMLSTLKSTDAPVNGRQRSDIAPLGEAATAGTVRWYGMSVYFPA